MICSYLLLKNLKLKQMVEMAINTCHLAKLQATLFEAGRKKKRKRVRKEKEGRGTGGGREGRKNVRPK